MKDYRHLAQIALNQPLFVDPGYARVFYSYFASRLGFDVLRDASGEIIDSNQMIEVASSFEPSPKRDRPYRVVKGIAVIPVEGSLTHKLGSIRPYSGMTGYDGLLFNLKLAIEDQDVNGILLDCDTPGGMVAGCFDTTDVIARYREIKPIWSLADDMNLSAGQAVASACSRRLITQSGRAGSIGVLVAHTSVAGELEQKGRTITLIHSGKHKVDGNPFEDLSKEVKESIQAEIDQARQTFAEKSAGYMGIDPKVLLDTEAKIYTGQDAVAAGLADELVNSNDAIALMLDSIQSKNKTLSMGANMSKENMETQEQGQAKTSPEANTQPDKGSDTPAAGSSQPQANTDQIVKAERDRVMGILELEEGKGKSALVNKLAGTANMSVEQAKELLAVAGEDRSEANTPDLAQLASGHSDTVKTQAASESTKDDGKALLVSVHKKLNS